MATTIIQNILLAIGAYIFCGFLFSLVLISKGLKVLDENSQGAGIGFKLIIIPGCMVFWPLLLKKWIKMKRKIIIGQAKE